MYKGERGIKVKVLKGECKLNVNEGKDKGTRLSKGHISQRYKKWYAYTEELLQSIKSAFKAQVVQVPLCSIKSNVKV